jgi:hypothetical protein
MKTAGFLAGTFSRLMVVGCGACWMDVRTEPCVTSATAAGRAKRGYQLMHVDQSRLSAGMLVFLGGEAFMRI